MATTYVRQRARSLLGESLSRRASSWGLAGFSAGERSRRCSVMPSSSPKPKSPLGQGFGVESFSRLAPWDRLVLFGSSAAVPRGFCTGASVEDYGQEVDEINLKFAVAREEIEAAMESKETVYFNEEADCAREAAKEVFDLFDGLLAKLPEKEKATLRRSMGLKIEQLKAELEQLND